MVTGDVPGRTSPGPGQTALPADVEHATSDQVAAWFSNRERVGFIRHWPNTGTYSVISQLPLLPFVLSTLRRYQRWLV